MKKTILFLFATFMLPSCSQDDGAAGGVDAPKAKISFEITSPTFDIDVNPLEKKSGVDAKSNDNANSFLQYIFYNSVGSVALNKIIVGDDLKKLIKNGAISVTEEMPVGEYHIAAACGKFDTKNSQRYLMTPEYYSTDNFSPIELSETGTGDYYYQVMDYKLELGGGNLQIELEPIHTIATLTIENPKTFKVPEGTEEVHVCVEPAYKGFWIAHKKGKASMVASDRDVKIYKLSDIRNMDTFVSGFKSVASGVETTIVLEYRNYQLGSLETEVIDTQEVKKFYMPDNGMSYDIHGSLEEGTSTGGTGSTLGFSIKEFSGESVDIPL